VPPVESLKKMLPADHLWPIDDVWNFHAGSGRFSNIKIYSDALAARYGASNSIDDFATKSQLAAYEGERAMFEAYAARKYSATGVVQWMLNNAWPSLIWHLYDAYLRPGGGYFGAKKACEPTHVQYSYDDRSIVVVTSGPRLVAVTVHARVFNLDGTVAFSRDMTIDVPADGVGRSFAIPDAVAKTDAYILDLRVTDDSDNVLTSNVYWLSSKPDVLDHTRGTGTMTPTTASADFSGLMSMRPATVTNALRIERRGSDDMAHVTLTNKSQQVAFFMRLSITKGVKGDEVLPVLWQDNYVTLGPARRARSPRRTRTSDSTAHPRRCMFAGLT
jgi:exo-1,4-beta-D-glucosaminidase